MRLAQAAHVSARGTSSLLRGRMSGLIVIYCDLKEWPTSSRKNRYSYHFVVFTECEWDEENQVYKSDLRTDLTFVGTNKNWECFVYVLRCMLTEARIVKNDRWILYVDNERSICESNDALAFITMMGGDIANSIPYLHLFIAENAVRRQSRIIWGILYHAGLSLSS